MADQSELKKLMEELERKGERLEALIRLGNSLKDEERRVLLSFNNFLNLASRHPRHALRNVFQLFYDMVHHYVSKIEDSKGLDNETAGFINYDFSKLFEKECDDPFFADRLFTNQFMKLAVDIRQASQNNRIFLFEGPPGSGKSTFLNILLQKLEDYTLLQEGSLYETYWRLDIERLGGFRRFERALNKLAFANNDADLVEPLISAEVKADKLPKKYLEFSCPNHDHPILQIPKSYRKQFLEELIPDEEFKEELFTKKEYEWILKDKPCGICNSIYEVLLETIGEPLAVLNMINVRKIKFSRQFGEGVSVFNPGDPIMDEAITNPQLQGMLNDLLKSDIVTYIYSVLAKTNNGVYALMDIKENNIKRMMDLHGIISDGIHKVGLIEERIKTLFVGLINPADKEHYEKVPSFRDRVITVSVPYVLDYKTEVQIFENKFGKTISENFLPRVLENVAKIIIASRLKRESTAIANWLKESAKYEKYTDKDFMLLKMELYAGYIPEWLSEEDHKSLTIQTRREIFRAAKQEGKAGISGRQSLYLLNNFLNKYTQTGKLIRMDEVQEFYAEHHEVRNWLPDGFINSLVNQYDYNVLQEIRESIYFYNKKQISRDIMNYLYSVNFEEGAKVECIYTKDVIEVTEEYFKNFEAIFLGATSTVMMRDAFRRDIQNEYVSKTLSIDLQVKDKKLEETDQFKGLFEKYTKSLKENALAPYINNDSFRMAIKDYNTPSFRKYDSRLKKDVQQLLTQLVDRFDYELEGAKQISLYALDKNLPGKF
jgi:predicted Ser/Thr protein kinase